MTRFQPLKNDRGQVVVEYILIALALITFALMVSKEFRSSEYFAKFTTIRWGKLAGMIESGVWQSPEKTRPYHPNTLGRHISVKGQSL